jgi:hypothetical protein
MLDTRYWILDSTLNHLNVNRKDRKEIFNLKAPCVFYVSIATFAVNLLVVWR